MLERERIAKSLQKLTEEQSAETKRTSRSKSLSKTLQKAKAALADQQQQEEDAAKMGGLSAAVLTPPEDPTSASGAIPYDEKVGKPLFSRACYPVLTHIL